ncbi:MAG: hypothetical protein QXR76_06480, partial [Candidatus Bathyarchaeia archaeon]
IVLNGSIMATMDVTAINANSTIPNYFSQRTIQAIFTYKVTENFCIFPDSRAAKNLRTIYV